jgi:hypothetical protein
MSQNSLVIPNTGTLSGLSLVNDANSAFDTLNTLSSGGSAPAAPEADMWWMDTTNGLLKQRNPANSGWNAMGVRGVPNFGGLMNSGTSATITGNTTLTTAQLGQVVVLLPAANITLTLPLASTYPAGTGFILDNGAAASFHVTIANQGSDQDNLGILGPGDQVIVFSDGFSYWRGVGYSRVQSQSIGSSGFERRPGGVIRQWGPTGDSVSGGSAVNFPTAFPNSCFGVIITPAIGSAFFATVLSVNRFSFGWSAWNPSASVGGVGAYYEALGN